MNWIGLEEYRVLASGVMRRALCFDLHRIGDMIQARSSLNRKPENPMQKWGDTCMIECFHRF